MTKQEQPIQKSKNRILPCVIRNLFILLIAALSWTATLWFAIAPNFTQWQLPALIATHALPPLLLWGSWWLIRRWRIKRREREKQAREAQEEAERQEKINAARLLHQQELAVRHFHCDCRMVVMQAKAVMPDALFDIDLPSVKLAVEPVEPDEEQEFEEDSDPVSSIGGFAPLIYDALLQLYDDCPAACVLPIYVVSPAHMAGVDVFNGLQNMHRHIVAAMEPLPVMPEGSPWIRFLSQSGSVADAVLSVFEADPELPGMVVLAFDSPLAQTGAAGALPREQEKWQGKPGAGVFAMLLTAAGLTQMMAKNSSAMNREKPTAMTPYWEREPESAITVKFLPHASASARDKLMKLPVIAHIRRGASLSMQAPAQQRAQDLPRSLLTLLERARVNAGLLDQPFVQADVQAAENASAEKKQAACGWLVHNAGGVECLGQRLAAIGEAMVYHRIDVDPIKQATNAVTVLGNMGAANGTAMLALSAMQSAMLKQPVLCTEFHRADSVTAFFTVPVQEAVQKEGVAA